MQVSNLMKIIVSTIIGVVVFAAILVPVLSEATTTHETLTNDGYYYMTDTTTEHTYVFDGTTWTVDGETLNHTLAGVNIIATDTFFIRDVGQVRGNYLVNGITACNLTVSEGAITGTYTVNSTDYDANWAFTKFYGATSDTTDYVLTDKTLDPIAYLTKDSEVFGYGQTSLGGTFANFQLEGSANDGITVTCSNSSVTVSDVTINLVATDKYSDLYTFEGVTFTATLDNVDYDCIYNIIIVPSEVTGELSVHPDASQIALINIIPLLVLVGLVLGVVGAVLARRD